MILLNGAYRVFFPAAGLLAMSAVPLWLLTHTGGGPDSAQITLFWHVHEMLFGYLGAALAGFLLTAIPNWTKRPALVGLPLLVLLLFWLAGRIIMLTAPEYAGVGLIFPIALAAFATREIVLSGNTRNFVVAGIVWLFAAAQAVMVWGDPWLAQRLGFGLAACMITLIGGRVTPAFTRNWLKAQARAITVPEFGIVDRCALISSVAAALAWAVLDIHPVTGLLALAAALAQAVRVSRWRGLSVAAEPLLLALHAAYGWLIIGWGLLALAGFGLWDSGTAVVHAFGTGAVGAMTLIVMIRALLGHSGQEITASRLDLIALLFVHLGAALRLAASGTSSQELLVASGVIWSAGFAAFVLRAVPLAVSPKV